MCKSCVLIVGRFGITWGHPKGFNQAANNCVYSLSIGGVCTQFCTQLYRISFHMFFTALTGVKRRLSTLSTYPTIATTTLINNM